MTRIDFLSPFPRRTVPLRLTLQSRIACLFVALAFAFDLGSVIAERRRWDTALHAWARSADARVMFEQTQRRAQADEMQRLSPLYRTLAAARTSGAWRAVQLAEIADVIEPHTSLDSIDITHQGIEIHGSAPDLADISRLLRKLARRPAMGGASLLSAGGAGEAGADGLAFSVRVEDAAP